MSRQSESVCATVSTLEFLSLSKEVGKNGRGAISNRTNSATRLRESGDIEAAKKAENEAEVMKAIAERNGFSL